MPDNYEKILKMAEFIQKYTSNADFNDNPYTGAGDTQARISAMEKRIYTQELLTIRSAIPHLEPQNRRLVEVVLKIIEIGRLLDYLKDTVDEVNRVNARGDRDAAARRIELMELIKPYLSPPVRKQMNAFIAIMQMADMFNQPEE